jgi:shikimate 5-dehydrogenase
MNGLPMLVHQAAVAWEIWMNQPAPLEAMWAAARAALQTPA